MAWTSHRQDVAMDAKVVPPAPGGIFIYRPTLSSILSEEASRLGAIIRVQQLRMHATRVLAQPY